MPEACEICMAFGEFVISILSDPSHNLEQMQEMMNESKEFYELVMQQTNFRLTSPVDPSNLKFWLINVQNWDIHSPKYNLYEITK